MGVVLGFVPYALISIVHVIALGIGALWLAEPTKLLLMPLLALSVVWALWTARIGTVGWLLLGAIGLSWIGDSAATFLPFAPTVPMMLLFFGLAHLIYMWLFARPLSIRRQLPWWTLIYAVWWIGLLIVLWPSLGALTFAVAAYGLVLGGTATLAARCHPLIAIGGAVFLTSDSILAFRLFTPDLMPDWTSPAVMFTYSAGQGLIAAGAVLTLRHRAQR